MTLLENEVVKMKGTNKVKKSDFILLNMITSLHVFVLASIVYLIAHNYVRLIVCYLVALFVYLIFVIVQTNTSYNNYSKFFGNDEIVITDEKVYYNICMNKKGEYINFDSFVFIKDINYVQVKKGLYPTRITITFNDCNEYVNIHCLGNAREICEYLSCLINKN